MGRKWRWDGLWPCPSAYTNRSPRPSDRIPSNIHMPHEQDLLVPNYLNEVKVLTIVIREWLSLFKSNTIINTADRLCSFLCTIQLCWKAIFISSMDRICVINGYTYFLVMKWIGRIKERNVHCHVCALATTPIPTPFLEVPPHHCGPNSSSFWQNGILGWG